LEAPPLTSKASGKNRSKPASRISRTAPSTDGSRFIATAKLSATEVPGRSARKVIARLPSVCTTNTARPSRSDRAITKPAPLFRTTDCRS
jgi:hypothetical protein